MPEPTRPISNTADEILDIAEMLIQTRGYSAISYQDIADRLGIRKASIHYHFPSKTVLGAAVVDRYVERIETALAALEADDANPSMTIFDCYTAPYLVFASTPDRVCLCGALAGEFGALPAEVRDRVEHFFGRHQQWLTRILKRGLKRGEFEFAVPAGRMAATIVGALQGALLIKRATGNAAGLRGVIAVLKSQIEAN